MVHVFRPLVPGERGYPDRSYEQAADVTQVILRRHATRGLDIDDPATYEEYYRTLYDLSRPQEKNQGLLEAIRDQDFGRVSALYRVIDQEAINVLVPYDAAAFSRLQREVKWTGLTKAWMKAARPHTVGLFQPRPEDPVWSYLDPVPITDRAPSIDWFIYLEPGHYDPDVGLVLPSGCDCLIA